MLSSVVSKNCKEMHAFKPDKGLNYCPTLCYKYLNYITDLAVSFRNQIFSVLCTKRENL